MNKALCLSVLLLVSGCAVEPVTAKFPPAPDKATTPCPALAQLKSDAQLSDLLKTVTNNYVKYHDCSTEVQGWNDWYTKQKAIFEDATKH